MPTKIEWADETWNPVTGCTPVSAGCKNCYAKRMARRLAGRHGYPEAPNHFNVTLRHDRILQPPKWRKPRRIFVCSMSDLFHKDVPDEFIFDVLTVVADCPQHTFLVLTKRPKRMAHMWRRAEVDAYPNLWLGVSAETQATADERIPQLLAMPAALHYLSLEPLLEEVRVHEWLGSVRRYTKDKGASWSERQIGWCIAGAETGPGARYMNRDWARRALADCRAARIPFFMKQMSGRERIPDDLMIREYPPPVDDTSELSKQALSYLLNVSERFSLGDVPRRKS